MASKSSHTGGSSASGGSQSTGGAVGSGGLSRTGGARGSGGAVGAGGVGDAAQEASSPTCAELAQAAQDDFDAKLAGGLSGTCQVDSDCTRLQRQDLNCVAACGTVVAQNGVAALNAAAPAICAQYVAAGCPEIWLSCIATTIICDAGRCRYGAPRAIDAAVDLGIGDGVDALDAPALADAVVRDGATGACTPPSEGAACTAEQTPCATCCAERWSCTGGAWKRQFVSCALDSFPCGDSNLACGEAQTYCDVVYRGGELPMPIGYACLALPEACADLRCPTCDCLAQAGVVFDRCTADAFGAITVIQGLH